MKGFKFEPVKWMTIILGMLITLEGVQEFVDLLPEKVNAYVLITIAVLTAILGVKVRGMVTALAAPKDDAGNPLVPATTFKPGGPIKPGGPMRPMGG